MIKKTLRNYLSNLKFVFTPIGILTIFALIGASLALTNSYHAVIKMFNDIGKSLSTFSFNSQAGIQAGLNRLTSLDWQNYQESLSTIINQNWIVDTLKEMAKAAFSENGEMISQIEDAAKQCFMLIVLNIVIFFVFVIIGIVVGYVVLKIFVTRQTVKRKRGKAILKSLLHTLSNLIIIAIAILLFGLLKIPLAVNLILVFLIFYVINLFESYLIFGVKKVPFKKVVHWKNIIFVILSGLIVMAITAALCTICYFIFNFITKIVLMIGIIQVGIVTNELLGETYIQHLIDNNNIDDTIDNSEQPSSKEEKIK